MRTVEIADVISAALGTAIIIATLFDALFTVVVPQRLDTGLKVVGRLRAAMSILWRLIDHRDGSRRSRWMAALPGLVPVLTVISWLFLLTLGFALVIWTVRASFSAPLATWQDALMEAASALLTLGYTPGEPTGAARWIVLCAAAAGFALVPLVVTWIFELKAGVRDRDRTMLSFGDGFDGVPSGMSLVETYVRLGLSGKLPDRCDEWRRWVRLIDHLYGQHPIVAYFRTTQPSLNWIAVLAAMLDAAAILKVVGHGSTRGEATLLYDAAIRAARRLCNDFTPNAFTSGGMGSEFREFLLLPAGILTDEEGLAQIQAAFTKHLPLIRKLSVVFCLPGSFGTRSYDRPELQ